MLAAIRLTAQVLLGVALFEVALGALWPLLGLRLEQQRVSTEITSIVGAAYYVGFVLGTMFCFPIIDRVGHIRAFSVFAIMATIATLLLVVLPHAIAWAALRAIIGFALAGVFTIVESWLNDKATSETRGRIFALYTMVAWGFSGLGPLGLNIEDSSGTILFCLIGIVMASAVIPVALTTVGNPDIGHRTHFGIFRLYKISPLGVLACFASGLINTGLFVLLPIYSTRLGYSTAQTSILLSIAAIGPFFIQYPVGWMADVFGRRPMMLATVLCAIALSTAIVNLPAGAFYWLVALTTLLASMLSPLYALGVGQTNDYVSKNDFVAASAGLLFAWGLGAILGPIAAAPAMSFFNDPNGLFYFISACHALLAAFILYRMISRPALSAKEQSNYVAVDAAHASSGKELDPRAPEVPTAAQASRIIGATAD